MDTDTFLTTVYVMADDFCKTLTPHPAQPGPHPSLTPGETLTLSLMAQWNCFPSQSAFYRWAEHHLRPAFPSLPRYSQFNRLVRAARAITCRFSVHVARLLGAERSPFQVLDTTAAPVRNRKRGGHGWLCGQVDIGWSSRLQWYEGFHVLVASTDLGVITGFGFGAASSKEQHLAEAFLYSRAHQDARLPSAGEQFPLYLADKGFEGFLWQAHWRDAYKADVITPPKKSTRRAQWSKALRRQMAGLRQIVETVTGKLHDSFALDRVRPHALSGFWAALAAKVSLHNLCIWINRSLGRPDLAFADLIDW